MIGFCLFRNCLRTSDITFYLYRASWAEKEGQPIVNTLQIENATYSNCIKQNIFPTKWHHDHSIQVVDSDSVLGNFMSHCLFKLFPFSCLEWQMTMAFVYVCCYLWHNLFRKKLFYQKMSTYGWFFNWKVPTLHRSSFWDTRYL